MYTNGNKIKKVRELRSFTQEYMADKLGLSQSNYARIENNEVKLSEERLQKIAEILETTVEAIKGFDENLIFNITNGQNSSYGQNPVVNNYQIDSTIQKLYEDKIALLEEKIKYLEQQLKG
jgi:transcriptional regulator with XRE-family HTH domain